MPSIQISDTITAADGTLRILKGTSVDYLNPFIVIQISNAAGKLSQLRETLGSSMAESDRFITTDKFVVPINHEGDIEWVNIRQHIVQAPQQDQSQNGALSRVKGVEGTAAVAILSTGSFPSFPAPILKDPRRAGKALQLAAADDSDGQGSQPNAMMLSEDQAKVLFRINSLFSGLWLNHPSHPRAFSSLFALPKDVSYLDMIQLADASTIDTKTTSTQTEATLFRQGFTNVSAELSTPWVSASGSTSQTEDRSQFSSESRRYVTSILRYPRAIISIDPESLKPTEQFKKERDSALALSNDLEKRNALKKLFKKYGHVFATQVELGGLLRSTEIVTEATSGSHTELERNVSAKLSAQISAFSPSASFELRDKAGADAKKVALSDALAVEAVGGDTTLASKPVDWPPSVIPYVNWRATKFSNVTLLTDIRSLFTLEHKNQIDKLFPAIFPQKPVQKLVGFYSKDKMVPGWFLASQRRDDGAQLLVRVHPNHPNPSEVFTSVTGYNLLEEQNDPKYVQYTQSEVYTTDDNYAAITVVEGKPGKAPLFTSAITCIKKDYLTKVDPSPSDNFRLPISCADSTNTVTADLLVGASNKGKFLKGLWVINMAKVELLPEELALTL